MALGSTGGRVVFLHGLFGQGRNWNTIAKTLATGEPPYRSLLVDLPNHGRSSWTDRWDLLDAAGQVADLLEPLVQQEGPMAVVGHSLGGKLAMVLALTRPDLVERLVVADISPVDYGQLTDFPTYFAGLKALPLDRITRREEADELLRADVPDDTIRGFLLQNLNRDASAPTGWRWAANLDVLQRDLPLLSGWPAEQVAGLSPYPGRVLWMAGELSRYVRPEYDEAMAAYFPRCRKVTIKGAGHWLHSEKPAVFIEVLRRFLDAEDPS